MTLFSSIMSLRIGQPFNEVTKYLNCPDNICSRCKEQTRDYYHLLQADKILCKDCYEN